MKKAIVTVGMGFGDEGKGACVDHLCATNKVDLVVRYSGGSQCGHNVQLKNGKRHCFSQFCAGTLRGVPGHLGKQVIVNPSAMHNEALGLMKLGVAKPYDLLTIHPKCPVSTVYHQRLNQFKELARRKSRFGVTKHHGSCGHGIGETRHYWLKYGNDAVFVEDLSNVSILADKLELLRQRLLIDMAEFNANQPLSDHQETTETTRELFVMRAMDVAKWYADLSKPWKIRADLPKSEVAVFEGAQGILLDEWFGFYPYVTWSTVTPHFAFETVEDENCREVCVLGITRAFTTRHGNGPLPTHDEALTANNVDPGNPHNQWQDGFRCGWLDLPLLKYSAEVCRPWGLDGLVVNHLDQIDDDFQVCTHYESMRSDGLSFPSKFMPRPSFVDLASQKRLGERLMEDKPKFQTRRKSSLMDELNAIAPVVMTGHGPTSDDRSVLVPLPFRI